MTDLTALPAAPRVSSARPPSRLSALAFAFKTNVYRLRRFAKDVLRRPERLGTAPAAGFSVIVAESRTSLWSDEHLAERQMQFGKVQNLRVAARHLNTVEIPAGKTFSFWRQLGRTSRARGFVDGRMLQEGCMVPAVGGGLCQLSNALYDVALKAGCEIVERHPHSRIVPGSQARKGRDATIAWNYVDLRFRSGQPLLLNVALERDELVVQLRAPAAHATQSNFEADAPDDGRAPASSCGTCGETSCFRHEKNHASAQRKTAFLLDKSWPEFASFVAAAKQPSDVLGIPLDGVRWNIARYHWDTSGFAKTGTATAAALTRSFATRRLAAQGPARQIAQLKSAEALAKHLAKLLTPDITDVCVAQSLLPFLWRDGHLAARRVSVLMTRLPIRDLQQILNGHAARHPERETLADFRAPERVAEWETSALAAADAIITPHTEIARLFAGRAIKLDWARPSPADASHSSASRRVAFPGPTVARKGCYELREAARMVDFELVPLGSEIESADFWRGLRVGSPASPNWLEGIALVVQPALIEHSPRRLLTALAAGVPVIATQACGLDPQPGLTLVREGDAAALAAAIGKILG